MLDPERFRQVDAIFDAALTRSEPERAVFLEQACGADRELRHLVEEMLASVDTAERALGEEAAAYALPVLGGEVDEDPPLVPGARLGAWQVVREIGRGGMGAVYLAERADGEFELRGAVKVVKRGRDTAEILRRFRDERRILASLDHPNVARVLDGGSTPDGRPYLVMEYVAGEPITTWCAARAPGDRARVEVFLKVCDAVHEAHRRLVVHRDIKPSNVLVTEQGVPKLLDFGIAKLLDNDAVATAPEASPLTPDYAAPEQLTGLPITTATDIFSLGLLLQEVLTGTRPSRVRTPERTGSSPSMAPTGPVVRGDLGRIIRRALAEEPERRYGSALQLREDLERWLKGLPVLARPDSIGYRVSRFIRRNAVPVTAAAIAAGLLVGLVFSIVSGERRTRAALTRAEDERDTAEEVTSLVEGIFAAGDPTAVGRERLDTLRVAALLDRSVQRVQSGLGRRPAVQARLLRTLGDAYRGLGLLDRAEPLLGDALAAHRGLTDTLALAEALNSAALVELDRSRPTAAEPLLLEAATIYRRSGSRRPDRLIRALANLATTETMLGRFDSAVVLQDEALARFDEAGLTDTLLLSTIMNGRSVLAGRRGEYQRMAELSERALELARARFGAGHPRTAFELGNLGLANLRLGHHATADSQYTEAVDILAARLGTDHPLYFSGLSALANARALAGRHEDAAQLFATAIEGTRRTAGPDALPTILSQFADLHATMGNHGAATALVLEARQIIQQREPASEAVGSLTVQLANLQCKSGAREVALTTFEAGLAILKARLPPEHPRVAAATRADSACRAAPSP